MSHLPALLACLLYVIATWSALAPPQAPERLLQAPRWGAAAALLHTLFLGLHAYQVGQFDPRFFNALAAIALACVMLLLFLGTLRRVHRLGAIVFPIAAVSIGLAALPDTDATPQRIADWRIGLHASLAVLAFATLSIAGVVAILLQVQDRALRRHRFPGWLSGAPALVEVEGLLFQLIGAGFAILTLALLTGVLFVQDLLAQHLAHKTVLSALSWLVFGVLLAGRQFAGLRGRRAVRLTLVGMALLALAYLGSKFVLDIVLQR